jgi:hypothetical protein
MPTIAFRALGGLYASIVLGADLGVSFATHWTSFIWELIVFGVLVTFWAHLVRDVCQFWRII